MTNATNSMEQNLMRNLSRAWSLIALGLMIGVAGTCLFFRSELETISFLRVLRFKLLWLIILAAAFIPPLVFEVIGGIRAWQALRKHDAEPDPRD